MKEHSKAFTAFGNHLLGDHRSLTRLQDVYLTRAKTRDSVPTGQLSRLERWALKFNWQAGTLRPSRVSHARPLRALAFKAPSAYASAVGQRLFSVPRRGQGGPEEARPRMCLAWMALHRGSLASSVRV